MTPTDSATGTARSVQERVTVDNFIRAETDRTFASFVKQGALGKFEHFRELAPIEDQHPARQPRHALFDGHLRPRRRIGAADGSITIQFGGCDGSDPNCLPTFQAGTTWYGFIGRGLETLNGTWKFPEATPVR